MKISHLGIKLSVGTLIGLILVSNLIYWRSVTSLSAHMASLIDASNHLQNGEVFHSSVHSMMMDTQATADPEKYLADRATADNALEKLKAYLKGRSGMETLSRITRDMAEAYGEFRQTTATLIEEKDTLHPMRGMRIVQTQFDTIFKAYKKLHHHHAGERTTLLHQTEATKKKINIMFAAQLALALIAGILVIWYLDRVVLKIYDVTETLALHDRLTGLYNRHALDRIVKKLDSPMQNREKGFGLVLLDIDHFKSFNDTLGHPAGDKLLKDLARVLVSTVRKQDKVIRIGGEEILVVLSWVDLSGTARVAEKIRKAVEARPFLIDGTDSAQKVTVSVGYASSCVDEGTFDTLFSLADQRLYAAKNGGRNRVEGP